MKLLNVFVPACWVVLGVALGAAGVYLAGPVSVDAGDWLAFTGSLLGVSLTVLGAVMVEERNRFAAQREDFQLLSGALQQLGDALAQVPANEEEVPGALLFDGDQAQNLLNKFQEASEMLDYARANSRLRSIGQVVAIHRVEKEMASSKEVLEREGAWIDAHGASPNVLETFNRNIQHVAGQLRPPLTGAIQALGGK